MDDLLFVLACTTDASKGLSSDYLRLVASLRSCGARSGSNIRLFTLFQGVDAADAPQWGGLPSFVVPLFSVGRCPLSVARNTIMHAVADQGVLDQHCVIGFPDDDCWFRADFFLNLSRFFDRERSTDFWFCRYGEKLEGAERAVFEGRPARASDVVRRCSSVTVFCRGHCWRDFPGFDEGIGLGTAYPGGEDMDYALRLYLGHGPGWCCPHPLVGHVEPGKRKAITRVRYFSGATQVLRRFGLKRPALAAELARKACVGLLLSARGDLSWSAFAQAVFGPLREPRFRRPETAAQAGVRSRVEENRRAEKAEAVGGPERPARP